MEAMLAGILAALIGGEEAMPGDWSVWTPAWGKAACTVKRVPEGLLMEAPGCAYAAGGATQEIRGIEPGKAYAVEIDCMIRHIPSPFASVLVRLTWTRAGRAVHPAGMLIDGPAGEADASRFRSVLIAPADADGATLSLELKWPQGGSVLWRRATVGPAPPPPPRKVKVGTVYLRPRGSTPERNLDLFCGQIDAAGKLGLDIVCLGEAITAVGTSKRTVDCAEPIPGPSTARLGAAAKRNRIWVVAGLTEGAGDRVFNTAVLIDRQGKLAGTYRKVHLPREEWRLGVEPGDAYPVFETDFGRIAIQICYDWFFPEAAACFALRGAEIIFAPTWGNTLPDDGGRAEGETVFRVRARDNAVYMVPSVYDGQSMVIDPMGRILAANRGREGVFWAEIDLAKRESLPWVGHWGSIGPRHRMPSTYGPLTEPPRPPAH
ncbi:MAG: carbon-nitrogen hydrolase family protein [Planctomycetes bacterium]|nr:carbon-nitrogen hydrolase family protein [Planctomycetota bacterium]